ncbi:MAG: sulfatase [Planctomycetota bacterium]
MDTLRPDHLGCYGYARDTSPNIDRVAREGTAFTNCYATDAPCLPSRAALFLGRFGIHNGVVGHGGTAADPYIVGRDRGFSLGPEWDTWPAALGRQGFYTVSVSPFAERHSAWWFYHGWREMHNPGKRGHERADEVVPIALDWLDRHGTEDNWFLHVHVWDPHTPYRTPDDYGNPFEGEPIPDWITEEMIQEHRRSFGPHSAREPCGFEAIDGRPRQPGEIRNLADYRRWIDGYDVGIRYADDHLGLILEALEAKGVLDDTAIIISSDHGENHGELNIYGDHHTADHITSRVPLIIRWPGKEGGRVDDGLCYNLDLPPTMVELLRGEAPGRWDGGSFASALDGQGCGRDSLVVSQGAWSCQRSVRFGPWMVIRTYHTGMKRFPPVMVFNVEEDPHETRNLAAEKPELADRGLAILERWQADMMATSTSQVDPLWTVMAEGGPSATRGRLESYCQRLRETGRAEHAEWLESTDGGRLA